MEVVVDLDRSVGIVNVKHDGCRRVGGHYAGPIALNDRVVWLLRVAK